MTTFIWVMIIILGIECACKVFLLAMGTPNKPTLASMACDVIIQISLVIWGVVLLSR